MATVRYYWDIVRYFSAMALIGFIMFFLKLSYCALRPFDWRWNQKRAKQGLTKEQCALLEQLWEADKRHYHMSCLTAKYRSHELRLACKKADETATCLHLQCLKANISKDQIAAYLLATYDFKG